MTLQDTYLTLRSDPRFATLSYAEQVDVTSQILGPRMGELPSWGNATPDVRQQVFEQLVFQAPVLSDPQATSFVADMGAKIASGDQEAAKIASNYLIRRAVNTQSIIANLIDNQLIAPLMDKGLDQPSEDLKGAANTLTNLPGADEAKISEYLGYLIRDDKKIARRTRTWSTIAGMGAQFAEIAAMYAVGVGFAPATAKGLGRLFVMPFQKALLGARTSAMAATVSTGIGISHAVAGGVVGATRQLTLDAMNGIELDANWQETIANAKQYFGEYFLGDVVMNIAGGVLWPMFKGFGKNFKGWGHADILKALDPKDMEVALTAIKNMTDIPQEVLAQLHPLSRKNILSGQNAINVFNKVGRVDVADMPEDVLNMVATAHGYGMSKADDGALKLWRLTTPDVESSFKTMREAMDWLNTDIMSMKNVMADEAVDAAAKGAVFDRLQIRKIIRAKAPLDQAKNADLLTAVLAPVDGKFSGGRLKDFARAYLGSMDAGAAITRQIDVSEIRKSGRTYLQLKLGDQELATIRSGFVGAGEELNAVGKVLDSLNAIGKNLDLKPARRITSEVYSKNLAKQRLYTPGWMDMVARDKLGGHITRVGDKWKFVSDVGSATHSGAATMTFDSLDQVGDFILAKTTSFEDLAWYLGNNEGLKLEALEDGGLRVLDSRSQELWNGPGVEAFLRENSEFLPKPAGDDFGPKITIVSPRAAEVTYVDKAAVGTYHELLKHLDSFDKRTKVEKIVLSSGGATAAFQKGVSSFEAFLPDTGYRRIFGTLDELKAFVKDASGPTGSLRTLEDIAAAKGYQLDVIGGDFFLHTQLPHGRHGIKAATIDEVKKVLADAPMPEWAPELTQIQGLTTQPALPPVGWTGAAESRHGPKFAAGFRESLNDLLSWLRPTETLFEDAVYHGGDAVYLKGFRQIEAGRRAVNGRQQNFGRYLYGLFKENGEIIPVGLREKILDLAEAPRARWDDLARELQLAPNHVDIANKLHQLWGDNPDSGFFRQFDVQEPFLTEYVPHMKKWLADHPNHEEALLENLLGEMYQNNPPKELVSFFKHNRRAEDLVNIVTEKDPLKLMLKYSELGNRDLFFGEAYKEMRDLTSQAYHASRDVRQAMRMKKYLDEIMGVPTQGEVVFRRHTHAFLKSVGINASESKDLFDYMMVTTYGATMSARPWLPIRNMHQIWTTLAPLTGNRYVKQGLQRVMRDGDGVLADVLRRKGMIMTQQPVFGGDILFDEGGLLQKLTQKGLRWYRNSDDFTRAVGWAAADARFTDAVDKFKRLNLTQAEFLDLSGANFLEPSLKQSLLDEVVKGNWTGAADIYNTQIVRQAFFPYQSGMAPEPFRGVVGKLFGQFGFYPIYYVDNIVRTLKYAPLKDKLAFAATATANGVLIYEAWKQVGVYSPSFLPHNPMFFSGGPLYHLMNQLVMAPTALKGDYTGRQAAAEALGISTRDGKIVFNPGKAEAFKMLIPGSFMGKSLIGAMRSLGEGDLEGFLIQLNSAPLARE